MFNFSGTVTSIDNPVGTNVWTQTVVGSQLFGSFAYDQTASPTQIDSTYGRWELPVTPGGSNSMNLSSSSFSISARNSMAIQVYRDPNPNFPIGGSDFQTLNGIANGLGLPQNATLSDAGFLLNFTSNNPNLSTLPNLPTNFLPLSQWPDDSFAFVDFRIGSGSVQSAFLSFRLDSVTAVPEPTSFGLVLTSLVCVFPAIRVFGVSLLRRKTL